MRERGFTLLEVIIVMGICSIILLLLVPITYRQVEIRQEETFLESFEFDLLYMQRLSLLTQEPVSLRERNHQYVILTGAREDVILRKNIPNGWKLDMKSLPYISFDHNGRIRQPFTIILYTRNSKYNIIFPMGKGRAYAVKQ